MSKVVERIERQLGVEGLVSLLSEKLSPTDLQSLMLEVYKRRSKNKNPVDVLSDYQTNRFVQPSNISPYVLLELESTFLTELDHEFEVLELSPVCPLGTNSVIASVDQNWAVSTARNTEVISDVTNVLALECAVRRKHLLRQKPKKNQEIHLAARHRFLRSQFYTNPDFSSHFQMFCLVSAGRDKGNLSFELSSLKRHLSFYLASLQSFLGKSLPLTVFLTDFHENDRVDYLENGLLLPIRKEFNDVVLSFNHGREAGRKYYRDLCFHIYVTTPSGEELQIADGGSVDWTQKLLSDRKERLIISGISSERIVGLAS